MPPVSDLDDQRGAVILSGILAISVMFVAFVLIAQFAVWQYGEGAVRAAANDAVRASAAHGSDDSACGVVFDRARMAVLGGSLGSGVGEPRCSRGPEFTELVVPVTFSRWVPFSPDWSFEVRAVAVTERLPQ
jgi:hypothetical protein